MFTIFGGNFTLYKNKPLIFQWKAMLFPESWSQIWDSFCKNSFWKDFLKVT